MAVRTYLYGYKGARRTRAWIDAQWQIAALHPEFRRRVWAMIDAAADVGVDLGWGGGTRTYAQQAALYKARNGVGVAPAGLSYHEKEATPLGAIAVDLVGNTTWAVANDHRFGLYDFKGTKPSEPWHYQPVEVPRSRREYKLNPSRYPIKTFPLPGNPKPTTPTVPKPPTTTKPPATPLITSAPPAPLHEKQAVTEITKHNTRWWQQILNERFGGAGFVTVDGIFGPKTTIATKFAQGVLRTGADGYYGPMTQAALVKFFESH